MDISIIDRVAKYTCPDPNSGCWFWAGALANGYPVLNIDGRVTKVTRLVLSQRIGRALLPEEHALHDCDVSICVNPRHLHVGSHLQNMRESFLRIKPRRTGEGRGKAKLTEKQVLEIRTSPDSLRTLAKRFGVASPTIHAIRHNRTWKHVATDNLSNAPGQPRPTIWSYP